MYYFELKAILPEKETGITTSFSFDRESLPGGAGLPTLVRANTTSGLAWAGLSGADGGAISARAWGKAAQRHLKAASKPRRWGHGQVSENFPIFGHITGTSVP